MKQTFLAIVKWTAVGASLWFLAISFGYPEVPVFRTLSVILMLLSLHVKAEDPTEVKVEMVMRVPRPSELSENMFDDDELTEMLSEMERIVFVPDDEESAEERG